MRNSIRNLAVLLTVSLIGLATSGFVYDESVDGELHQHGNNGSAPRFRLDRGTNVIKGSSFVTSEPFAADSDQFMIQVPSGMVLQLDETTYRHHVTAVSGDIRNIGVAVDVQTGRPQLAEYSTGDASGPFFAIFSNDVETPSPTSLGFFKVLNSSVDPNQPVHTLPAGDYLITLGAGWESVGQTETTWDYELTFVLTPVP